MTRRIFNTEKLTEPKRFFAPNAASLTFRTHRKQEIITLFRKNFEHDDSFQK